jgi:hypothetical protein
MSSLNIILSVMSRQRGSHFIVRPSVDHLNAFPPRLLYGIRRSVETTETLGYLDSFAVAVGIIPKMEIVGSLDDRANLSSESTPSILLDQSPNVHGLNF